MTTLAGTRSGARVAMRRSTRPRIRTIDVISVVWLVVLLAFVMLALSVLVITLISGKFEQQLKEFNKTISGIHKADVGRMSVARPQSAGLHPRRRVIRRGRAAFQQEASDHEAR